MVCVLHGLTPDWSSEIGAEGGIMWLDGLQQDEIALRLDLGESLTHVQAELIETADCLSEDERAALWLSYRESARHDAGRMLAGVGR